MEDEVLARLDRHGPRVAVPHHAAADDGGPLGVGLDVPSDNAGRSGEPVGSARCPYAGRHLSR